MFCQHPVINSNQQMIKHGQETRRNWYPRKEKTKNEMENVSRLLLGPQ